MKKNIQSMVDNSLAAWESWNGLGYTARINILSQWAKQLDKAAQQMLDFQCSNALEQVSETLLMPGPTGEDNELYCAGRGVFIVTADAGVAPAVIVGQITAALVTGNTLLLCLPAESVLTGNDLVAQLLAAGCPKGVVENIDYQLINSVVEHQETAGVVYAGQIARAKALARSLAARDGLLAQLIAEIDCVALPVIGSPGYIFRFVTERTRTINITAVGGNAKLLELGSGEH